MGSFFNFKIVILKCFNIALKNSAFRLLYFVGGGGVIFGVAFV